MFLALTSRPYGIDDFFPEMFRRLSRPFEFGAPIAGEIKIDVTENDKDYEVRAEIPGAKKEDIRISVDGNFVSISAEAKKEREEKSKGGRLLVRDSEIDDKAVVAKLEDGILKLTLPKREGAKARRIEVQ